MDAAPAHAGIPATLGHPDAARFWLAVILTGIGAGIGAIVPLLLAVVSATLVARSIEPRSIYDARLTDEEVAARQRTREPPPHPV